MRVVLASGNPGKLRELSELLSPLGLGLVAQSALGVESPPETGATFLDNALLKARHAARVTGLPALADDSGIEVDALGGRPGVYSARYAGENAGDLENLQKMLRDLDGVPPDQRGARYQCVLVLVHSAEDAHPIVAEGTWEGRIALRPVGAGGFGYDPIFIPAGLDGTAAQLEPKHKNRLSHRGRALRSLVELLRSPEAGTNAAPGSL